MSGTSKTVIYDCTGNPPPKLDQIGNTIFEKTQDVLAAPFDETLFQRTAEQTHEVYRTYRHYLGLRHFVLKHGIVIDLRGHWHLDVLRLQDVCTCIQRRTEPTSPMDPGLRLKLLRQNRPFKTAIGEVLQLRQQNQQPTPAVKTAPTSEVVHSMPEKKYVLYLTREEFKIWTGLKGTRDLHLEYSFYHNSMAASIVNRLMAAGHVEEMPSDSADHVTFRYTTNPNLFHVHPIEERKTKRVAEHWLKLIELLLKGEFVFPSSGSVPQALNEWARSKFPNIGKNAAYVMLMGFDPSHKYDRLGLLLPNPKRKNHKSGEFLIAVPGFTAYEFATHQATETASTETPEPPKPQTRTEAPPAEPAKTRRSIDLVSIKLFDEAAILSMDDPAAEQYLKEIHAALESLQKQLKFVETVRAKFIQLEIQRLEEEALERMQRVEQLKKRLPQPPPTQESGGTQESPTS